MVNVVTKTGIHILQVNHLTLKCVVADSDVVELDSGAVELGVEITNSGVEMGNLF